MTTNLQLSSLPPEQLAAFVKKLEREKAKRTSENLLASYYPDDGPLRRELYPKHMAFFAAGKQHRERAAIAATARKFPKRRYRRSFAATAEKLRQRR